MDARTAALDDSAPRPIQLATVKVAVLVDLTWGPHAGGHVKCWEHLATAAACFAGKLDLTVYFSGSRREIHPLGKNVRYVIEPPVFSTRRLGFLSQIPAIGAMVIPARSPAPSPSSRHRCRREYGRHWSDPQPLRP